MSRRLTSSGLLGLLSSLLIAACGGLPDMGEGMQGAAPSPGADAAAGVHPGTGPGGGAQGFSEIGAARIPDIVTAGDYILTGCAFSPGRPLSGHLALEEALSDAPEAARKELDSVLSEIERLRTPPAGAPAPSSRAASGVAQQALSGSSGSLRGRPSAVRVYELAVASRWIVDIDVEDHEDPEHEKDPGGREGTAVLRAKVNREAVRCTVLVPRLLKHLRGAAFRALRQAMRRPRPSEPWHHAALAAFLALRPSEASESLPSGAEDRSALRREVLEYLRTAQDPGPLAAALVPRALLFDGEELSPFVRLGNLPLRILGLVRVAASGQRQALDEILVLSLEYFGKELLFAAALRTVFPPKLNGRLHRLYPEAGDSPVEALAFVQDIRGRMSTAMYVNGEGWKLEGG